MFAAPVGCGQPARLRGGGWESWACHWAPLAPHPRTCCPEFSLAEDGQSGSGQASDRLEEAPRGPQPHLPQPGWRAGQHGLVGPVPGESPACPSPCSPHALTHAHRDPESWGSHQPLAPLSHRLPHPQSSWCGRRPGAAGQPPPTSGLLGASWMAGCWPTTPRWTP